MTLLGVHFSVISRYSHIFNLLFPFTRPGTPLLQDVIHTLILCTFLWYAPRILERRVGRQVQNTPRAPEERHTPANEMNSQGIQEMNEAEDILGENPLPDEAQAGVPDEAASFLAAEGNGHLPTTGPEQHDDDVPLDPPPTRPVTAATRNVGKKKAKSLARKDERRAYHEFMRSQGDAQRAQEREEAAEQEQYLAEERQRRAKVEAELEEKNRRLREQRKQEEREAWQKEMTRRKLAVSFVRESIEILGWANLNEIAEDIGGDVDAAWVEKLCRVEGVIQDREDAMRIVTSSGFIVEVSKEKMREACEKVAMKERNEKDGLEISWDELAEALDDVVRPPSSLAAARALRAARLGPR
ncbi:MAG: hypothetical protein M1823_000664 [Watsoniomyces obsoletus]|nr:MAG: hypothetical protein M1823_000664 [Watsoniomyces obsoletus]